MANKDRLIGDAIGAEIIDESPDTILVRYGDGVVDSVSKHSTHGLLCTVDWLESSESIVSSGRALIDRDNLGSGGTGTDITFDLPYHETAGQIIVEGTTDPLLLYGEDLREALSLVVESADVDDDGTVDQSQLTMDPDTATELYEMYESILESRVRENIIDELADYFRGSIELVDEGWIVADTYLVTYEGENYLVGETQTYKRNGGDVTKTDGTPQAVKMSFRTDPIANMSFGQETYTLSEVEQAFVATVEVLLHPDQYLGVESFENEVYSAVVQAKGVDLEDVTRLATTTNIEHFVDPKTGLLHRHDLNKHVLRTTFDIRPWVINELFYDSFDHAGVAELSWREDEFRNSNRAVFYDTENDDDERWSWINKIEGKAPCPPEVYQRLNAMYGTN